MATASRIEWTETTWNPVVGCSKVSQGCQNCYAERMAVRLAAMARGQRARGAEPGRLAAYEAAVDARGRWQGSAQLVESALDEPSRWRGGRLVFVNSMSDLFHASLPLAAVRTVLEVVEAHPQHTFQVLTKRPERAAELAPRLPWPANLWLGTSVENQAVRDRIRELVRVPAAVRFLSLEPLLGPLRRLPLAGIHWVIVGGESGPGARPLQPEWVRDIRDRCLERGVPFFFKQWGGVVKKRAGRELDGDTWDEMPPPSQAAAAPLAASPA